MKEQKVRRLNEVGEFASEEKKARPWAENSLDDFLLEETTRSSEAPPLSAHPMRVISVRMDEDTLQRLKAMARRKGKRYQTLLREFVLERLYEEEKREGIL